MEFAKAMEEWKLQGKTIATKCLKDGTDVNDALALHQKDKPKDAPFEIRVSDRLVIRFTKLKEVIDTKTKEVKLSGGNVCIDNEGCQQMYQPVGGFAYFIDAWKSQGLNDKMYNALKTATIDHLPHTKHHKASVQGIKQSKGARDADVKVLADNRPYVLADIANWK
jgi:hypothetical protein